MKTKVTFKKHPQQKGLSRVGNPYRGYDIKIKKVKFGTIYAPSWRAGSRWGVQFAIEKDENNDDGNSNCSWMWLFAPLEFESDESAKEWIQSNIDEILNKYTLHYFE